MRWVLAGLALFAAPAAAQTTAPGPLAWNPVADYITAGQDEPGYKSWYLAAPWRAGQVKAFNDYLASYQVAGIFPTWQLLRTATSWAKCGGDPFEVPPTEEWPHIVQTLRYVHDYVIPAVGPIEPVSGYRNPVLNKCAGGAPESAHKQYSAIDMVPLQPTTREALMRTLCGVHARRGPDYGVGLGFYAFLRFHVDTTKFRRWNMDPAVASHCPPIVHPIDIATVAQPQPGSTAVAQPQAASTVRSPAPEVPPAASVGPSTPAPERGQPRR